MHFLYFLLRWLPPTPMLSPPTFRLLSLLNSEKCWECWGSTVCFLKLLARLPNGRVRLVLVLLLVPLSVLIFWNSHAADFQADFLFPACDMDRDRGRKNNLLPSPCQSNQGFFSSCWTQTRGFWRLRSFENLKHQRGKRIPAAEVIWNSKTPTRREDSGCWGHLKIFI